MSRWEMTYLGMDLFIAECSTCDWTYQGSISAAQNAAVRHVREAHL